MSLPKNSEKTVLCALTDGWIDLKKNNVSCGKIIGSSIGSACASDVEKGKGQVLEDAIQDYEEKDIFNAGKLDCSAN